MGTRSTTREPVSPGAAERAPAASDVSPAGDERAAAAVALVGQDHRRLANRCAALAIAIEAGADAAAVRECIVGLIEAAREHFVNEEWAMRTIGWPDYLVHKSEHARLLRDARDMLENFDVAFTSDDWPALATYFRHWLDRHHHRHDDALLARLCDAGAPRRSAPLVA